jgi:acyl carrier protein
MNKEKFLNELASILDVDANILKKDTKLNSLSQWDSMAKLSLIVLLADNFKLKITSQQLNEFKIVNDILTYCNLHN